MQFPAPFDFEHGRRTSVAGRTVTIPRDDPTPKLRAHALIDGVTYDQLQRDPEGWREFRRKGFDALDDDDLDRAFLVVNPIKPIEGDFISLRVSTALMKDRCELRATVLPRRTAEDAATIPAPPRPERRALQPAAGFRAS